jgi:hypothetical protein
VGGSTPAFRARSEHASSIAPLAPIAWPCIDFVELIGTWLTCAPNTCLTALVSDTSFAGVVSDTSFAGVPVPCALM